MVTSRNAHPDQHAPHDDGGVYERPPRPLPTPRRIIADFGTSYATNGLIGLIFSASGPVAVILAAGAAGHLDRAVLSSWIFGVFALNGALTILASWVYRTPLAFAWTIPGTVLVGSSLQHLSWPEVLGAFVVTSVLITAIGLTGQVRRVMSALPQPIVMAMVAGVFMQFGINIFRSMDDDPGIAVPIVVVFVVLLAYRRLGRFIPPIIGALVAGALAVAVSGRFHLTAAPTTWLATPALQAPQFSIQACLELVIPLAITVIVVQNGQGTAVLESAGHRTPVNVVTIACGVFSGLAAAVGAVSSCLAGPTNALLVAGGQRERQYTAALTFGILAIVVGLAAPLFVELMLATPAAFVAAVGGLALLGALQNAFRTAFSSQCTLGALVTLLVTISGVDLLNIGAAFWGLLAGLLVAWAVEREDVRPARAG
ncbi:benzoate/H(+) symporter BenE family transporter [Gordonia sp. VNK1]|uniref:benzoate/H(+) symporter BenE family transporter n=1 Tax=Gordonia oleivorans TaxID=3156618 RepID=UPI0032B5F4E7